MNEPKSKSLIKVGRIVGAFGIKGQVKVELLTEHDERFVKDAVLYLDGQPLRIKTAQWHKDRLLLAFDEFPDANAAESLQWKYLEAEAIEFELEKDEYRTEDLVGLMVMTVDGRPLGKVEEVLAYPAHDILRVDKLLIPAVKQFVKEVDISGGRIVVELLEGMEEG